MKRSKETKQEKKKRAFGGSCADMGKFKSGRSHTHTHGKETRRLAHTKRREPHFCAHFPTLAHVPQHHPWDGGKGDEFIGNL